MIKESIVSIVSIENLTIEKSKRNNLKAFAIGLYTSTNLLVLLSRAFLYTENSPQVQMGLVLMVGSVIGLGVFEKIYDRSMRFIDSQIKAMNENNSPDARGTEI